MISDLDWRLIASDHVPIRSALAVAAEVREELAALPIWEIRVGYDGAITVDMLNMDDLCDAIGALGLWLTARREETRREIGYRGTWHGSEICVITAKPSRVLRAWLRITGRLK